MQPKTIGALTIALIVTSAGFICVPQFVGQSAGAIPAEDSSRNTEISEGFTLKLTDSDGNDLSDPLFGGKVVIYFDTIDTPNGTIYRLKAMLSIKTIPANLLISAPAGTFKMAASATGFESFLEETGMRITVTDGDKDYSADLLKDNNYSSDFMDGTITGAFDPNVNYSVSVNLMDGYESAVPPEVVNNIALTFQATVAGGIHQVAFISEGETVKSYLAFDGDVISDLPSVSRSGYSLQGWFTPDGREITEGYVISPDEGDIVAIASWEEKSSNTAIYVAIGGGSGLLIAALLLLLLLKRRNEGEAQ
ncbi:MAG: hypothetical protein II855_01205 [Candidatus Methanomethylophilaceae archaeon]|nr:hypothetical protein [Candidatus Methanomethylophilaceae archaeon]